MEDQGVQEIDSPFATGILFLQPLARGQEEAEKKGTGLAYLSGMAGGGGVMSEFS